MTIQNKGRKFIKLFIPKVRYVSIRDFNKIIKNFIDGKSIKLSISGILLKNDILKSIESKQKGTANHHVMAPTYNKALKHKLVFVENGRTPINLKQNLTSIFLFNSFLLNLTLNAYELDT